MQCEVDELELDTDMETEEEGFAEGDLSRLVSLEHSFRESDIEAEGDQRLFAPEWDRGVRDSAGRMLIRI